MRKQIPFLLAVVVLIASIFAQSSKMDGAGPPAEAKAKIEKNKYEAMIDVNVPGSAELATSDMSTEMYEKDNLNESPVIATVSKSHYTCHAESQDVGDIPDVSLNLLKLDRSHAIKNDDYNPRPDNPGLREIFKPASNKTPRSL